MLAATSWNWRQEAGTLAKARQLSLDFKVDSAVLLAGTELLWLYCAWAQALLKLMFLFSGCGMGLCATSQALHLIWATSA